MRSGLAVCLVAAGCSYRSPIAGGDGSVDTARGGAEGGPCQTFSHQLDTCGLGTGNALALSGGAYHYSTGDGTLTLNGSAIDSPPSTVVAGHAGPIRVIIADAFSLASGSSLRVDGAPAFGVASPGAI